MIVQLQPVDGRKSFYGKAYVEEYSDRTKVLYSYNTPVAAYKNGILYRLWEGYSATTMRHVKAFTEFLGIGFRGKNQWDGMEVSPIRDILF